MTCSVRVFGAIVLGCISLSCASAPKASEAPVSRSEAAAWFERFCSVPEKSEISGSLVLRSKTPEFKGQFPATVRFQKDSKFVFEVTNIVGGTMAQLEGNSDSMSVTVTGKPHLSKRGLKQYLGIELSVLIPILRGELPCPPEAQTHAEVEKNVMKVKTRNWTWTYTKSSEEDGSVPVTVELVSGKEVITLSVEQWDENQKYLAKGHVRTPGGELKWTWRSREKI